MATKKITEQEEKTEVITKNSFEVLNAINVNEYTEEREGLTYLTWSKAWAEVKKIYPDATYEIEKFENNLPYVYDENTGYMVFTSVTIEGLTYEMWLPVMDSKNKAMKSHSYTYTTKWGEKSVEPATMFDVNKTIMRCLVKNLAMFGLGLYIYSGEDLPEVEQQTISQTEIDALNNMLKDIDDEKKLAVKAYWVEKGIKNMQQITQQQRVDILNLIK